MLTPVWAQYPGQVKKDPKAAPALRAVAVLEWTGDPGKPKTSRIVPLTIYDGEKLQDAGIYMARPAPLALSYEVEYQLERNGQPFGLFDIKNAGQEQGSWVGFGAWKAIPQPKPLQAAAPEKIDDAADEKPVLHRKKGSGDSPAPADKPAKSGSPASGSSGSSSTGSDSSSDDDRPKLHKKDDSSASSAPAPASTPAPAPDSNRPVLHKPADANAGKSNDDSKAKTDDSDRPTLHHGRSKPPEDTAHVDSVPDETDPDRPRLKRGRSSGPASELTPTLMGLPEDMQQAVAVSDARTRPAHPWTFTWANPDDEIKMKEALEDLAREALGMAPPAPARAAVAPRRPGTPLHKSATAKPSEKSAALPVPLEDEQFRVFELAYGAGATMVLSASNTDPLPQRKFITLIAQPDLYGKPRILLKSVTDMAHLDQTPRMRLVDAVDALADNRGELLFELRGDGSRQFALYRIYRGTAEQMFVSGGEPNATTASNE